MTEWEEWKLNEVRSTALQMAIDFAFKCGRALEGLGQFDRTCSGNFYFGHGGSINVQLKHKRAWVVDVDERLFTMTERPSMELLQACAHTVMSVLGMHFEMTWEHVITPCQSPICENKKVNWACSFFAGRWMCGECVSRLSLCETVYHRTGETTEERSERDKMTASLRYSILERDKFTCQSCGRTPPDVTLHVDHKIPVALGGKTLPENLHVLCRDCNLGKSAKMPSQATLDFWEQVA